MGRVSEDEESPREEPSSYSRTTNGLLASLLVTVLAVGGFVLFREVFRGQPEIPRGAIDYLGTVEDVQEAGVDLVYPSSVPEGWHVTHIDFVRGKRPAWGVGMLTDDGRYVGLRQEDADVEDLLEAYVDKFAEPGDQSTFDSGVSTGPWQTWADADGDLAYSTTLAGAVADTVGGTLLVYGSASRDDQELLISLLTMDDVG